MKTIKFSDSVYKLVKENPDFKKTEWQCRYFNPFGEERIKRKIWKISAIKY